MFTFSDNPYDSLIIVSALKIRVPNIPAVCGVFRPWLTARTDVGKTANTDRGKSNMLIVQALCVCNVSQIRSDEMTWGRRSKGNSERYLCVCIAVLAAHHTLQDKKKLHPWFLAPCVGSNLPTALKSYCAKQASCSPSWQLKKQNMEKLEPHCRNAPKRSFISCTKSFFLASEGSDGNVTHLRKEK